MFLASITFSQDEDNFVQYLVSLYYFICAGGFLMLAIIDRASDFKQAKRDAKIIAYLGSYNDDLERLPFANFAYKHTPKKQPLTEEQQYTLKADISRQNEQGPDHIVLGLSIGVPAHFEEEHEIKEVDYEKKQQ